MAIPEKLRNYLSENGVSYTVITHPKAYTAQETAAAAHVTGKELAKVVIVKLDGKFAMAVAPAPHQIDFERLKQETRSNRVELASEKEIRDLFPDCETGAMPPYGNLYDLPVYVARPLTKDAEIVFSAGSHHEAVRMKYAEYARLVQPNVIDYTLGP